MFTKKILAIISTAVFFAGTSAAYSEVRLRNVEIKKTSGQFTPMPVFKVVWKGNKLVVKGKSFKIPFQASADLNNVALGSDIYAVSVQSKSLMGTGASLNLLSANERTKKFRFDSTLSFTQGHLTPVINSAIRICQNHHKTADKGKKKSYPIRVPLDLTVTASHAFDVAVKKDETSLATTVICPAIKSPKLASEQKKENKPTRTNPFKVKKAKLKVVYGPKACPQLVILQASFETNKPGAVKFRMRDSKGAKSIHTVNSKKVGKRFMATYNKSFKANKPVTRKYMVETLEFAKGTAWMPVNVRCGVSAAGGLTTTSN